MAMLSVRGCMTDCYVTTTVSLLNAEFGIPWQLRAEFFARVGDNG